MDSLEAVLNIVRLKQIYGEEQELRTVLERLFEQGRALGLQQERERLQALVDRIPTFLHSGTPVVEMDGQQLSPYCIRKMDALAALRPTTEPQ